MTYTATNLVAGVDYTFKIASRNAYGLSP